MGSPLPLRDYQLADLAFLMATPRGGLLHDPGCGKTPPICVYIEWIWRTQRLPSIWVMPKSLLKKNFKELLVFTNLEPGQIAIMDGINSLDQLGNKNIVAFLITADFFRKIWNRFPTPGAILADESHMFWSSNGSQRTQAWYQAMRSVPRYVGITGTLIDGRLDSAYPTIHVIEPRYYGSHGGFLAQHALQDEYGKVMGWHSPDKLAQILAKYFMRRSFESVYGPESKVIVTELCEMSPKQRDAYSVFESDALLELEDSFLTGDTGGVHAIRCRQIMAHPETFGLAKGEMTGKDERLEVHLATHKAKNTPFLIFASLVPEQERITRMVQKMGMSVGLMNGGTSSKRRSEIDEDFASGKLKVVVASPKVTSFGFNWGHLDHMAFASLDYKDSTFLQAMRRGIRGVREKPLLVTVLEYADSIDQRIFQIIKSKSKMSASVDGSREIFDLSKAS